MAQPKRSDINKVENFLKNSADNAQTLSYWNAAVSEHGKTIREIDENLASNDDNKQIAELLLRPVDAIKRLERLINAIQNAIKVEMFSTVIKAMQRHIVELQRQNANTGRLIILMSALQDENLILNYLDLEEKKRDIDDRIVHNKKLRDERIENGEDAEEDYAAAYRELLQDRSDLKMKLEALLKSGEAGAILRSLEDAEQRLADVRASVAADKSGKYGTSTQEEPQPDNEQKEHNCHNADDIQKPQNGARSLPKKEMSIHSQGGQKMQRNLSVFKNIKCKTSYAFGAESSERARRTAKAPAVMEREAKQLEREAKEKRVADLQEEVDRKARIAEKEIEMAKVSSSCGSSFRSISPVETPDNNLTKVADWMDKTEEAENVA